LSEVGGRVALGALGRPGAEEVDVEGGALQHHGGSGGSRGGGTQQGGGGNEAEAVGLWYVRSGSCGCGGGSRGRGGGGCCCSGRFPLCLAHER
jgi:hypothetical protein